MFAAPIIALGFASFAAAAPVSSSAEAYVSTYISASEVWTSRFANATYTANATVTVAETTVTVTFTPTSTSTWSAASSSSAAASSSSSTSEWVAPSSSAAASSSSSTSEWVAPSSTSSTSEWHAPSSSVVAYQAAAVETSSTYEAPAPAATSAAAPSNSGDFHGTATYYYQNGAAGSCGNYNSDDAHIVAVNAPQVAGTCGKTVTITNNKNGKTMTAVCADTCPGCAYGSLDMSSGLFAALGDGDFGQGVFPISWSFN